MENEKINARIREKINQIYKDLAENVRTEKFREWMRTEKGVQDIPDTMNIEKEWKEFVEGYDLYEWKKKYEAMWNRYREESPSTAAGEMARRLAEKSLDEYKEKNTFPHKYLDMEQLQQFWKMYYLITKEEMEREYPGIKVWFFWKDNKKEDTQIVFDDSERIQDDGDDDDDYDNKEL